MSRFLASLRDRNPTVEIRQSYVLDRPFKPSDSELPVAPVYDTVPVYQEPSTCDAAKRLAHRQFTLKFDVTFV